MPRHNLKMLGTGPKESAHNGRPPSSPLGEWEPLPAPETENLSDRIGAIIKIDIEASRKEHKISSKAKARSETSQENFLIFYFL